MTRIVPMGLRAPGALCTGRWACQFTPLGPRSSLEPRGLTRGKEQLLPESNKKSTICSCFSYTKLHLLSDDHFQIGDLVKKDPFSVYDYAGYTVGSGEIYYHLSIFLRFRIQAILFVGAGVVSLLLEHLEQARNAQERCT